MARLPHADQGRFPVPRLDSGRAAGPRSGPVPRPGPAHSGTEAHRHSGVAELLLQVPAERAGTLSRARPVHSVDEAEEHASAYPGRGPDYTPRAGILRLSQLKAR